MDTDKDLTPTKCGSQYHGITGIGTDDGSEEERHHGRRVGVRESDSDYVKLAKQGGQKDLLSHQESVLSKTTLYKPSDWFCPEAKHSSPVTNGERKAAGAQRLLDAPFGTSRSPQDWSQDGRQRQGNTPDSEMEMPTSPDHQDGSKFKKTSHDKKPAPVDMSKLLSFGYAEDTKPSPTADMSD